MSHIVPAYRVGWSGVMYSMVYIVQGSGVLHSLVCRGQEFILHGVRGQEYAIQPSAQGLESVSYSPVYNS